MKHFRQYIYEQHKMDEKELKNIVEAILLSSNEPISLERLLEVFDEWQRPTKEHLGIIINDLKEDFVSRSFEVVQVATGFIIQTKKNTVTGLHACKLKNQLNILVLYLKL